jgi:hypothetical protein
MKHKASLALFTGMLLSMLCTAQTDSILFIGNSYVATNNLPGIFSQLAQSGGRTVFTDLSAPGGYTFNQHSTNATTLAKIAQGKWDFVILQEQSQIPSFPPSQVQSQCYPYAARLDSLIHAADSCTRTVFFMTWGRKYGDASNCANYPPLCTFEGMQARLRASYVEMSGDNQAIVSPVGQAFKYSRDADSTINLYSSDNSHPSAAGTYLAACVFYQTLFQSSPVGLSYTAGLNTATASFLQNIAHQTVTDSLLVWHIGEYQPTAAFSFTQNGSSFSFQNNSTDTRDYLWDFGDGNTSNEPSPVHTYATSGPFSVTLTAALRCTSDVSVQSILVTGGEVAEKETIKLIRKGRGSAILQGLKPNDKWVIYGTDGRRVQNGQGPEVHTALSSGIYFIDLQALNQKPFMLLIE